MKMREEHDTDSQFINVHLSEDLRRLAGRIKENYDSEEFQVFWQPAKSAILHGDVEGIRAWANERMGTPPDFVLKAHLRKKELGDATPRETWALVDDRGEKLTSAAKGEADALAIAVFNEKTKKFDRLKHALSECPDPTLEVARAILVAGAESPHGYPLTMSVIQERIEKDSLAAPVKGTPGKDSSIVKALQHRKKTAEATLAEERLSWQARADATRALSDAEDELSRIRGLKWTASLDALPSLPPDTNALEEFRQRENWRIERLVWGRYAGGRNEAGLSPREQEVFQLALLLENHEIAEKTGRSKDQIGVEKHRAIKKVRQAIGS